MPFESGARIGPYDIVSRLGAGGMGEVYRARDRKLNRDVAIKVMLEDASADPGLAARFEREAQTLAALNHPNIAQIYGYEESAGTLALVMELVEGGTLAERIAAGPIPVEEGIALAAQMAEALAYAHDQGVIHRDLKPANVKLRRDGTVKILDFGLAKKIEPAATDDATVMPARTMAGIVMGTPGYMAPELMRGGQADVRTDIFAFGVMLFEVFTGRHPFNRSSVFEIGEAILNPQPAAWPADAPPVPELVQFVVQKAVEKNAQARYQSFTDLRNDLRLTGRLSGSKITPAPGTAPAIARPSGATAATAATPIPSAAVTPQSDAAPVRAAAPAPARRLPAIAATIVVLGGLGFAAWRYFQAPPVAPAAEVKHTQVTFVGNVRGAAFSPDGRTAAYVARTEAGSQLMVRDVAGGNALPAWTADLIVEIQWMPDGSQIIVSGILNDQLGIWVLPRMGGTARPLAPRGVRTGAHIAVSPAGDLVATAYQDDKAVKIFPIAGGDPRLIQMGAIRWLIGLDWGEATNRIAVLTQDDAGVSTVWTVSPDGGGLRKIYSDRAVLASLRWSPFGDVLYVLRANREVGDVIRLVPGEGETKTPDVILAGLPWDPADPFQRQSSLSTDGKRLLYVRGFAYSNLWRLAARGGSAAPITQGTSRYGRPMVSPDGTWIAAALGSSAQSAIVKLPIAGGEPVTLTSGDTSDVSPAWSPDGQRVAFASSRGGAPRIWLVPADGGPAQEVRDSGAAADPAVAWTPDGRLMWLKSDEEDYVVRQLATGASENLAAQPPPGMRPGQLTEARVSPRGDAVAVWWNKADQTGRPDGLWLVLRPSREERLLVEGDYYPAGWSADGAWVFAYEFLGREVIRVPAAGGKPVTVGRFPIGSLEGCGLAPDGQSIICAVAETKSDAWLVENFDPRAPLAPAR